MLQVTSNGDFNLLICCFLLLWVKYYLSKMYCCFAFMRETYLCLAELCYSHILCDNRVCMFLPADSQASHSQSYFMSIWHNRLYLYSAAALVFGVWFSLKMAMKKVNCHLIISASDVCNLRHIVLQEFLKSAYVIYLFLNAWLVCVSCFQNL